MDSPSLRAGRRSRSRWRSPRFKISPEPAPAYTWYRCPVTFSTLRREVLVGSGMTSALRYLKRYVSDVVER